MKHRHGLILTLRHAPRRPAPTLTAFALLLATFAAGHRAQAEPTPVPTAPPKATAQNVLTAVNTPVNITLKGSGGGDGNFSYSVVTQPTHGALTGTPPNVTYTPVSTYQGDDSFTFTVSNGTSTSSPAKVAISVHAPHRWTAQGIAVGSDNLMRVLWTSDDGRIALWVVGADGKFIVNNTYGPFTGWHAIGLAVGGDNKIVVLWLNDDKRAAIWRVGTGNISDGGGALEQNLTAGPYEGWVARAIACGADAKIRVLWVNADGRASVWVVAGSTGGTVTLEVNNVYGPYPHWHAVGLAVDGDGRPCLLWDNDDGTAALWRLSTGSQSSGGGTLYQNLTLGPFDGWTAKSLATGPDGKFRVLWDNLDGRCAIWVVGSDPSKLDVNNTYGPYTNWDAAGLSVGGDGSVRALWNKADGTTALWQVAPGNQSSGGGAVVVNNTFGPY